VGVKIYIETSIVVSASLGSMLGGKQLKHERYDTTFNLLQYAEQYYQQQKNGFFTTHSVVIEAKRVIDKALNSLLESKLPKLIKKGKPERLVNAEKYHLLLNECTDQLETWLSYLKCENYDNRKKSEIVEQLQGEFQILDIEFRKANPGDINHFHLSTRNTGFRRVCKAIWTEQRKEALEEYKPKHGRTDIEIMAEIASINQEKSVEVYIASEDRHFYAKQTRDLLEQLYGIKCRRSHELLADGMIKKLLKNEEATPAS